MNEVMKAGIRLIVTAVLLTNSVLTAKGMNPIPFDESTFAECAAYIMSGISAVWVWWKNNNITQSAKIAQDLKAAIKEHGAEAVLGIDTFADDGKGTEQEV